MTFFNHYRDLIEIIMKKLKNHKVELTHILKNAPLNYKGKYTVKPTINVIIVTACLKKLGVTGTVTFLVTLDRDNYFCRQIWRYR